MRIAVIQGGFSEEAAASRRSGAAVTGVLQEKGHQVLIIEYTGDVAGVLKQERPDLAFIMVQGKYHGDGTVQSICELLKIPYTGTRTTGAAIINDKIICKELWKNAPEIKTPAFFTVNRQEYALGPAWFAEMMTGIGGYPAVLKPPTQGGSVGIEWLKTPEDYGKVAEGFAFDECLLVEKFVAGRYITQPILEVDGVLRTFSPVEGTSTQETGEFRKNNGTGILSIPQLPPALREEITIISKAAFQACHALSYARADFILDKHGHPHLLEINAVPGLAETSLMPYAVTHDGIAYADLIEIIVNNGRRGR